MLSFFNKQRKYIINDGAVYSTSYHIVYESPADKDLQKGIQGKLTELDYSLSIFNPDSTISKINRNQYVCPDSLFRKCFKKAREISLKTQGAFDMTIGPLVNAWGFGFKNKEKITQSLVDKLLMITGHEKIKLFWWGIKKDYPDVMIDASAIAKGLAVDRVAGFLRSKRCRNYLVEIGGEVAARGVNSQGRIWRVGITKPVDEMIYFNQDYQDIVNLSGKALATSGNYRNYYTEDDKRYAHTINPKTGYPVEHSLLSATVLADDCMTADAYATAFMVLGVEKSLDIANSNPRLECYLIYGNENGEFRSAFSDGFKKYLV